MIDGIYVLNVFAIGVLVLSCYLWAKSISQWRSAPSFLATGEYPPIPWGLLDLLLIVLTMAVVGSTSLVIYSNFLPASDPTVSSPALTLIGKACEVAAVFIGLAFIRVRYNAPWSVIGIEPREIVSDLRMGIKAGILIIPPTLLIHAVLSLLIVYKHDAIENIRESQNTASLFFAAISPVFFAPISEEIFIRMLLFGWFLRLVPAQFSEPHWLVFGGPAIERPESEKTHVDQASTADQAALELVAKSETEDRADEVAPWSRPIWPLFLTSLFFGAMHWGQGAGPITLFLFSLCVGYIFYRTHRIIPCIVVHFLLNLWTILLVLASQ